MTRRDATLFRGTDRYLVRHRIGAGGMGVVYAAYDNERDCLVALKTLRRFEASALYRFKQEFRALADVTHPNLVSLYELVSAGEQWFFTMELVEGVPFDQYVRKTYDPRIVAAETVRRAASWDDEETDETLTPPLVAPFLPASAYSFDEARVRSGLAQLVHGVAALHAAGKLHRDLKPSNVLVTPDGRVVVLDFGLVTELAAQRLIKSREAFVAGTAEYMAPEQGAGFALTPASDWYGVGVILYEALVGRRPFEQTGREVMLEKQRSDPRPPRAWVPSIPKDLDALCTAMLHRDPQRRPTAQEIFLRLGRPTRPPEIRSSGSAVSEERPLLGREEHLATLTEALRVAKTGRTVAVFVRGSSGMGKTALVRSFLDAVRGRDEAIVLAARCYEQESVPYKAVDGLIDALAQHLLKRPVEEVEGLVPERPGALGKLFPVLLQVLPFAEAAQKDPDCPSPQETRRSAFAAARELFARVARRKPVVLSIDDLHWGDADSNAFLAQVLRQQESVPLCLIVTYREEETAMAMLLKKQLGREGPNATRIDARDLVVGPLEHDDAKELAMLLLGKDDASAEARAEEIATESGGSPFFVDELLRYSQATGGNGLSRESPAHISLDQVITARLVRLDASSRRLLEVVAVAGQPITQGVALRAADLGAEASIALRILKSGHLVRTRGSSDHDAIESYHDRVRETVLAHLSPVMHKTHHLGLALALAESGDIDPETLASHFEQAGELSRAAKYAELSALIAENALAFDRAADLYRRTIDLKSEAARPFTDEIRKLKIRLGDALANAGRGSESAAAYLSAVEGSSEIQALDLERRAAEQLLRSGRIDEGLAGLSRVLSALGLELASTPKRALASLLLRRAQLGVRGLAFAERPAKEVREEDLARIDICWSVAAGLSTVDNVRGADFQTRHLILALDAGEPYRVARALATEAAYSGNAGRKAAARTDKLLERARSIAQRLEDPLQQAHATGLVEAAAGIAAYGEGRYKRARERCDKAEHVFRAGCTGVVWEVETAQLFGLMALYHLGAMKELSARVPYLLKEAQDRGDLYAETNMRIGYPNAIWLAADDPAGGRLLAEEALEEWSRKGYNAQHYFGLVAESQIDLYLGEGARCHERVTASWPTISSSLLLRVQFLRIEATALRGRAALAAAAEAPAGERKALLASASDDAAKLFGEKHAPHACALSELLDAGVRALRGDGEGARKLLEKAIAGFEATDMALHAACARRVLGRLVGGSEGAALVERADVWMGEQKIRRPARMTKVIAPAFVD